MEKWANLPTWIRGPLLGLGALFTTVVSGAAAWPHIEPWLAAHRGYVRDVSIELDNKTQMTLLPMQRSIRDATVARLEERQNVIENDIARWELQLAKATDDIEKLRIGGSLRALKREQETNAAKMRKLGEGL